MPRYYEHCALHPTPMPMPFHFLINSYTGSQYAFQSSGGLPPPNLPANLTVAFQVVPSYCFGSVAPFCSIHDRSYCPLRQGAPPSTYQSTLRYVPHSLDHNLHTSSIPANRIQKRILYETISQCHLEPTIVPI